MSGRRRYAVVGLGSRSRMYTNALLGKYAGHGELVGLCDVNATRMAWHLESFRRRCEGAGTVATYHPDGFARMLREQAVDAVIVTSVDRTHHRYIVEAVRAGCDVITEKPLTIDGPRCQAIVDAVRETGRRVLVAFNYRYAPRNARVKQLLDAGAIGRVLSAHFEWLLDTTHGADYYRRWHRDKRNSGGLMIHKASHHFDLMNWWLRARPESVFGFGRLAFYGRENAEERGVTRFYERAHGSETARTDPFALHLEQDAQLKGMYLDAEHEDGYLRDRSVFADGISIEDDMALVIRYSTRASLTYHLTSYSPWEGYRVVFNGTEGRLEFEAVERSYVSGSLEDVNQPEVRDVTGITGANRVRILVRPLWRPPQEVRLEEDEDEGGHAGADVRLLEALFGEGAGEDPLGRNSTYLDGVFAILPGVGANQAFATGLPVDLTSLVRL